MCLYFQIRTDGICIFPAFLKLLQEPSVASGAQCKTFAFTADGALLLKPPFPHLHILCIFVCNPVTQHSPLWSSIYSCLLFAAAFWAIDEFLILGCKSFVVAKVVKVGLRVRVWYISWRKAARRILLLQKFELERMWNHLFTFEHFLEHGQADKKRLFELNCIQLKSIIIFGPETYTCALFVLLKSTFGFKISQLIPSSPIWPTCSWWRVPRW